MQSRELLGRLAHHPFFYDRVAPINRLGLVAGNLHRGRARNVGAFQIADGCSSEIVHESIRDVDRAARAPDPLYYFSPQTRGAAGLCPRVAEITDRRSVVVDKDPRDDRAACLLDSTDEFTLRFEDGAQLAHEREHPPFA